MELLAKTCRKDLDWKVIGEVEPYARGSGASLQERRWGWCELISGDGALHEPWRYVSRHLESSTHSSPCVIRWDNAQPTVRYLTRPISRTLRAKAQPLRPHVSTSHSSCLGLWHLITHEHLFCLQCGLLELCQCFSHSANCSLPCFDPGLVWSQLASDDDSILRQHLCLTTRCIFCLNPALFWLFAHGVKQCQLDWQGLPRSQAIQDDIESIWTPFMLYYVISRHFKFNCDGFYYWVNEM